MNQISVHAINPVRERIERAALRSGRDPSAIQLVVVTKGISIESIRSVVGAGATQLGENRVQEALPKIEALGNKVWWHFLGHLQKNKVRQVVEGFKLIQSVDRFELAKEIHRRAEEKGFIQEVLLQVNVAAEDRKYGVSLEGATKLASEISAMPGLDLKGLMSIPPFPEDPEDSRPTYRKLASLARSIKESEGIVLDELSMGMSIDFEVAIEEGSTMVRVGTAIFSPSGLTYS